MNILDQSTASQFIERLCQLEFDSRPLWGKMNAAEMLAHCRQGMELPLGKFELRPNFFFKLLFGKWVKSVVVGDKPFKINSPTAPEFKIHDKGLDFESEKSAFLSTLSEFTNYSDSILEKRKHGLFGTMTAYEWRKGQWNHLDHHWRQFGI